MVFDSTLPLSFRLLLCCDMVINLNLALSVLSGKLVGFCSDVSGGSAALGSLIVFEILPW